MRRQVVIGLIMMLALLQILPAQDRKYQRKTITTVDNVIAKDPRVGKLKKMIDNRFNAYVKLPRFDYQVLPPNVEKQFNRQASQTDLSPSNVEDVMNRTVLATYGKAIAAKSSRASEENMTDVQKLSALRQKEKEMGATREDILKAMNAGYTYIPVITAYTEETENNNFKVHVEGYILWYRLVTEQDGTSHLTLMNPNPQIIDGEWTANPGSTYGLKSRKVDGTEYAKLMAIDAWARNLSLDMRRNPEFQMSGDIKEVNGGRVLAQIGSREGIKPDEGYNLVDFFENDKGEVESKDLGFFRVVSVANNDPAAGGDPFAVSTFTNYIGSGYERGMILTERPRMGLDLAVSARYVMLNIPKTATVADSKLLISADGPLGVIPDIAKFEKANSHPYLLSEDATAAIGADLELRYNLSKLGGWRQFFLTLTLSAAFPMTSFDATATTSTTVTPLVFNGYVGLLKKLWFGRMNLSLGVQVGADMLRLTSVSPGPGAFDNLTIYSLGAKGDAALEFLLSPDWTFSINAGYKYGIKPLSGTLTFKGEADRDLSTDVLSDNAFYKDLNFTGASVSVGISYAFPSLSSNPFAGLESSTIDY